MTNVPVETSILILCKNEEKRIGACLEMIYKQDYAGSFEVIVVDSGSTDRTLDIVRQHPVRLFEIPPQEFDFGRTRNFAARQARGLNLVNLTAHAIPVNETWLSSLIAELEPDEVAGVYGRQLAWDWAFPMERYFLDFIYGPMSRIQSLDKREALNMHITLFSNVNSAIKRELWERWPWTERGGGSEDQVWSNEALRAGYRIVYSAEAAVYHTHNYGLREAFKRFYESGMASHGSYLPEGTRALSGFGGTGLRYLTGEVKYLGRTGALAWLPRAMAYEAAKASGLITGRFSYYLPQFIADPLGLSTIKRPNAIEPPAPSLAVQPGSEKIRQ